MRNISRNIQHILIPLLHSALRLVSSELNQTFPDKSSHMEFLEISCPITFKAARQRPFASFELLARSDAPLPKGAKEDYPACPSVPAALLRIVIDSCAKILSRALPAPR